MPIYRHLAATVSQAFDWSVEDREATWIHMPGSVGELGSRPDKHLLEQTNVLLLLALVLHPPCIRIQGWARFVAR